MTIEQIRQLKVESCIVARTIYNQLFYVKIIEIDGGPTEDFIIAWRKEDELMSVTARHSALDLMHVNALSIEY